MKICLKCNQFGNDDELNCRFCSAELEEILDSDELPDINDIIETDTVTKDESIDEDKDVISKDTEDINKQLRSEIDISFDEIYSELKKEIRLLKIVILFFVVIVIQLLVIISLL